MSWTLIEHQSLSSSAASVTLGSGGTIPQTYKTLKLLMSARSTYAAANWINVLIRPNGATTNLSSRAIYGDGSGTASFNESLITGQITISLNTANTFANNEFTFPNYTSTTVNKPVSADLVTENNATTALQMLEAGLWSSTAAITSLDLVCGGSASFVSGSTFTLYGLA